MQLLPIPNLSRDLIPPYPNPFPNLMLPISSLPFSHRSANPVDPSSSSSSFPLTQEGRRRRRGVQNNNKNSVRMGISSNSSSNWQWQRALGQLFNREGAASLLSVAASEPRLALPHLSVPDIRWVDWPALHRLGFRGVVFDKDNTLTAPYSLSLWPPLDPSFRLCRSTFPAGSIAIFSNSAGLKQFDPDGEEAKALEKSIGGIHVIRHEVKKPAGTAEDIERYFGCPASLLVMVGDRIFTDIVYGNKHGFLTILTEPLCLSEEPFIVKQVRKLERLLVNSWHQKGFDPPKHALLAEAKQCIKAPSS